MAGASEGPHIPAVLVEVQCFEQRAGLLILVRSEPLAIGRGITPPLKGGAGGGRPPAHPPVLADAGLDALPASSLPLELELVVPLLPLLLLLLPPPLLLPLGLVVLLPLRLLLLPPLLLLLLSPPPPPPLLLLLLFL